VRQDSPDGSKNTHSSVKGDGKRVVAVWRVLGGRQLDVVLDPLVSLGLGWDIDGAKDIGREG